MPLAQPISYFFYFSTLMMFDKQYKSWSSSLCSIFQSAVFPSSKAQVSSTALYSRYTWKWLKICPFRFYVYRPGTHCQPGGPTCCPGVESRWMPPWDTRPPPHSTGLSLQLDGKSLWRAWLLGASPSSWRWVKETGTWASDCKACDNVICHQLCSSLPAVVH